MYAFAVSRLEGSAVDGIHLIWAGPRPWGYSLDGFRVLRRRAIKRDLRLCVTIDGQRLARLHAEHVLPFELGTARYRRDACPRGFEKLVSDPHPKQRSANVQQLAQRASASKSATVGCAVYRIDLATPQQLVRVRVQTGAMLVVALREEKVVAARQLAPNAPPCETVFRAAGIDRVVIYCGSATAITLCVVDPREADKLDSAWSPNDVIAHLQLPVRELDPSLASPAEELATARGRMLDPSLLDGADLEALAVPLRRLTQLPGRCPSTLAWLRRESVEISLEDYGLLDVALVPAIEADLRRAYGLAHRDAKGIEPAETYDYQVIGRFPEVDIRDRLLTFAAVPLGTALPSTFALRDVHVRLPCPRVVESYPPAKPDTLDAVCRRGIAIVPGEAPIVLSFATPVRELSLELEPVDGHDLAYRASAGGWAGIASPVLVGSVPAVARAKLEFPSEIDRIELAGRGFLHGVRVHGVTGAARDEKRIIDIAVDVHGVTYAATPAPPPPLELAVTNLQRPIVRAAPGSETAAAPASLGFRLEWRPAPAEPLTAWPSSLGSPPPLAAAGFRIERQRVDVPGPWEEIGGRLVYGQRFGRGEPPVVAASSDLLALFDDGGAGDQAVDTLTVDDPLWPPGATAGPDLGSEWQYRIAAVDLTGRLSDTWTTSPVVMLEKHRPPPLPAPPPPLAEIEPRGVRAQLLQRESPDLSVADRALLGARDSLIRLDWAWTAEERAADPHAREFRVYLRTGAFDVVAAEVRGPITPDGANWRCTLVLDRDVGVDEHAGARLHAGALVFGLVAHAAGTAGTPLDARVRRRKVVPQRPALGRATLRLRTRGDETRALSFHERSHVIAIEPGREHYHFEWSDGVTVTAEERQRVYWVGVSSADGQWYVDDALAATATNGGRAGNESQIVARSVTGRYLGRPTLEIPPPLADIPERVTDEPQGDVRVLLPLTALVQPLAPPAPPIAPGTRVQLERVAASEVTTRLAAPTSTGYRVRRPDGTEAPYAPLNPSDLAVLAAELATGMPTRVSGRFICDILRRVPGLDALWRPTGAQVPFGDTSDVLPGAADRWVYRLRIADAAGRLSANAILLDEIVRVPSLREPGRPELAPLRSHDASIRATARVRSAFDLPWVLFFIEVGEPTTEAAQEPPTLVRIPNRRDLYPGDGIRLRTRAGAVLAPVVVAIDALVPDDTGLVTTELVHPVGERAHARVWCASLTRDGIPSAVTGPSWCTSGGWDGDA